MPEKVRGLLDSARAKLTGLLGDFPQGFNAGAVAGFPGWAGDMAYMADTARLALTGADQQAAPENYVGTTDYIAKQAGYPVPQTLSGQLGAAVGGLMSPGPGDLAKFAPVLSAIPFWHGSPHKFDAFDLSHMGKGEGAQAYGWGAYGAESPEVAKQYLNVDPSVPVPPRRQFMGQDLEPGTPEYHAARLASEGKESLAGLRKLVAGWISDARPGEPTDGYQKTLEILNQAQKKSDFKQLKPEPYLYRGEYRWPDPAKEAATPLTGEDLLQWDRPLSEQPESFRDALIGLPEIQARISASERQRVKLNELHPARIGKIPSADKPIDASRITGDEVISTLRQSGLSEADVSKKLLEMGIPGIRYLDGMSRTDGSGTHNIVMFDDKGIKLLERNGTPIEDFAARRAGKAKPYKEAMRDSPEFKAWFGDSKVTDESGAPLTVYHGTNTRTPNGEGIYEFDPGKTGTKTDHGYMGEGFYFGDNRSANAYAGHYEFDPGHFPAGGAVYPVHLSVQNPLILSDRVEDGRRVDLEILAKEALGLPKTATAKDVRTAMETQGYDGAMYGSDGGYKEYVALRPEQIKSAIGNSGKFDPKNPSIVAGTAAAALSLGLARQQMNEQESRNGM